MFIKLPNSSIVMDTDRIRLIKKYDYNTENNRRTVKYDIGSNFQPEIIELNIYDPDVDFLLRKLGIGV